MLLGLSIIVLAAPIVACSNSPDGLTVEEYKALANEALTRDDYYQAASAYEKAISIRPDDPDIHFALARVYIAIWGESINETNAQMLQDALRHGGNQFSSMEARDQYYGVKTEYRTRAFEEYKLAVKYNPSHYEARYKMSIFLMERNDYQGAIYQLQKALEINPEHCPSYNGLGEAYIKLRDYSKAVDSLEHAVECDCTWDKYHFNLAVAYRGAGRAAEYIKVMNYLKKMDSTFYQDLVSNTFGPPR